MGDSREFSFEPSELTMTRPRWALRRALSAEGEDGPEPEPELEPERQLSLSAARPFVFGPVGVTLSEPRRGEAEVNGSSTLL